MRPLRYIPPTDRGRTMVEVTARTLQGRSLLRPGSRFNRIYYGVLARAQSITGTQIHAFSCLSTHHHILCSVEDAQELARFMRHVQGNLSREVGRLHDWQGRLWQRRYRGIVVDDEEQAQLDRFVYILDQGCKDGLVSSPLEWPGPNSAWALVQGHSSIQGDWIDRTGLYRARRGRTAATERDFTIRCELELTPLPCWTELERAAWARRVQYFVGLIEEQTRSRHRAEGSRPLGGRAIVDRHPHARPTRLVRSPAPRFHAKTAEGFKRLVAAYNRFLAIYRRAAAELRAGNLTVEFPSGCFPPPRGFIPLPESA